MPTQWFAKIKDQERGPLSASQLKCMAESGELLPSTSVRRGPEGSWVAAERVKGLFTRSGQKEEVSETDEDVIMSYLASAPSDAKNQAKPIRFCCPQCKKAFLLPPQQPTHFKCPHCNTALRAKATESAHDELAEAEGLVWISPPAPPNRVLLTGARIFTLSPILLILLGGPSTLGGAYVLSIIAMFFMVMCGRSPAWLLLGATMPIVSPPMAAAMWSVHPPRYKITLPGKSVPKFPAICPVTGQPTPTTVQMRRFIWKSVIVVPGLGAAWTLKKDEILIPMSEEGLTTYLSRRPRCDALFEQGMAVCSAVPLIPLDLMWAFLFAFCIAWWLHPCDVLEKKCTLFKLHWSEALELTVSSKTFAVEFIRKNPLAKADAYVLGPG